MSNIPVLLLIYNRPEYTKKNIANLRKIKPKKIYIFCDGPKNERDKSLCLKTIKETEKINWKCTIKKKFLNKRSFPYGKKINFNSIRKGEIIGEHEVKFSSGKEIITLNHEAFDRTLYSDGALTASKWLMKKKPGLYSMRDLLNFS